MLRRGYQRRGGAGGHGGGGGGGGTAALARTKHAQHAEHAQHPGGAHGFSSVSALMFRCSWSSCQRAFSNLVDMLVHIEAEHDAPQRWQHPEAIQAAVDAKGSDFDRAVRSIRTRREERAVAGDAPPAAPLPPLQQLQKPQPPLSPPTQQQQQQQQQQRPLLASPLQPLSPAPALFSSAPFLTPLPQQQQQQQQQQRAPNWPPAQRSPTANPAFAWPLPPSQTHDPGTANGGGGRWDLKHGWATRGVPTDVTNAAHGLASLMAHGRTSSVRLYPLAPTENRADAPAAGLSTAGAAAQLSAAAQAKRRAEAALMKAKRIRRPAEAIDRRYPCSFAGCTKAYGTLSHLNTHIRIAKHFPLKLPADFPRRSGGRAAQCASGTAPGKGDAPPV